MTAVHCTKSGTLLETYFIERETRYGEYLTDYKGKGKATPLQAWTGPEGSRMLRLPDFKTIST